MLALGGTLRFSPGPLLDTLNAHAADAKTAADLLWRRDPAAWTTDDAVRRTIANRLGWLESPKTMAGSIDRLTTFAESVRRDGFTDVVLLGMGGSSLAPEVLRAVVGVAAGWPRFHMLDSTDPAAVQAASTPPPTTLYILASKSGTTIEPNSPAAHFQRVLTEARVPKPDGRFVAITDEGTELAARARRDGFRDLFINPSDIGGRYSALSFFGLVPAALMGQDVAALIRWAAAMRDTATKDSDPRTNPAVGLGLALGAAARHGRDKLTLLLPDRLQAFGLWVEQLIAESTGKHGEGIVPIAGERPGPPDVYGSDRVFVRLRLQGDDVPSVDVRLLERAGAPIVDIDMPEPLALGAEFMRWEIATAIAGALLRINPFDEPNVQQAKDATKALLARYKREHELPIAPADRTLSSGATLTLSAAARQGLGAASPERLLTLARPGDYVASLAYLGPDASLAAEIDRFRHAARDRVHTATMVGYGPRYLHSTGQLHKGGPNTGVFVLITATPRSDIAIPGEEFSFGTLELAQALGDFASLEATGRRALHVHLPAPDAATLRETLDALSHD